MQAKRAVLEQYAYRDGLGHTRAPELLWLFYALPRFTAYASSVIAITSQCRFTNWTLVVIKLRHMHRQLARISVQIHSRHTKWFPQRCAWLSSYLSVHGSICVRAWLWKPLFADFFSIQCQLAFSNRAFVVKGLASEVSHKILHW